MKKLIVYGVAAAAAYFIYKRATSSDNSFQANATTKNDTAATPKGVNGGWSLYGRGPYGRDA